MSDTGIPEPEGDTDIIDTDYEIGQDNIEAQIGPFGLDIHNPVFAVSAGVIVLFVVVALIFPQQAADFFGCLFRTIQVQVHKHEVRAGFGEGHGTCGNHPWKALTPPTL